MRKTDQQPRKAYSLNVTSIQSGDLRIDARLNNATLGYIDGTAAEAPYLIVQIIKQCLQSQLIGNKLDLSFVDANPAALAMLKDLNLVN